jgi:hypothetical protein
MIVEFDRILKGMDTNRKNNLIIINLQQIISYIVLENRC